MHIPDNTREILSLASKESVALWIKDVSVPPPNDRLDLLWSLVYLFVSKQGKVPPRGAIAKYKRV